MERTFETELPEGYAAIMEVDAQSKKLTVVFTCIASIVSIAGIALGAVILRPSLDELFTWKYIVAMVVMFAYIVLHELVHGVAYKLLTGRKLTFGISLTVAYCGVPDIFVYRKTALISLLAPFTVFGILFLLGSFLLPTAVDRFLSAAMLALHLGGCVGDLYDTLLYMTKLRDPLTLMKDTGPKQTFYQKAK